MLDDLYYYLLVRIIQLGLVVKYSVVLLLTQGLQVRIPFRVENIAIWFLKELPS